ncbi:bifunctional diaminohydroxyphosphoribosylaminopyrimidine deaminase/5-amino-6-(5-phosphoribosylamino)uracil reductase RibD [Fulvivirga lutea]|uniref:Riboflavin biosynthesis protein RibD n=1 Tax=Fulvivirga lutea TaxID=2810512 RepID=A0A975A225_9BACT|nr:bifunctional diaminohydroxyphosphoribosylaminopyrimidine deaminase/5-amino-6-(5-phosphoribosylamino)uracil reductase RibD [Fulvivirga lutea]QSE98426.1 bifunctional diaminohydroxyphosphoribosylaminopyrimidine deaminase/5-amino-6-(5-phosphoribosylamino)uracil reductase RibD [Fulvivirga lutea]
MLRALELASNGLGYVSPNPMVGCVIVHNNKIIGEGWHRKYGEAHAEVNAINSVKDKSKLSESTVYVTLEPCAHTGKTPPCADLLIEHSVNKVVIANVDTNPLVGGKGIEKLRNAGIEVETGRMEEEGRELNRRFFTFIEKKRPYVLLKWAQTADGYIARKDYDSKWISGEESRKLVHKWRSEEPGIMVATHTAKYDNPRLDVRDWSGNNPVRIVIDKNLELPQNLNLFDGTIPTLCYNMKKHEEQGAITYVKVSENDLLDNILTDLYERGIQSVLVEGGAALHKNFIDEYLWDEARVFVSKNTFGGGIDAARISLPFQEELIGEDKLLVYRNKK